MEDNYLSEALKHLGILNVSYTPNEIATHTEQGKERKVRSSETAKQWGVYLTMNDDFG